MKNEQLINPTWSDKQQIQYELARDMLTSYSALLSRVAYKMMDLEVDKKITDKIIVRVGEISREKQYFNGFDDDKVVHVIKIYSQLKKEFDKEYESDEIAAKNGLAKKYLETKAFSDERG